jgi:hypothetical protein
MSLTYATPTDAIRVFCGFPNSQLNQDSFFAQLGQTFMPGTPYMLQPLGLAAYLPGVISNPLGGIPNEFALICYPSQQVWDFAMHKTLRGRVYNQTHTGVYASPASAAAFPRLIDDVPATAVDPLFLFPDRIDWQTGTAWSVIGGRKKAYASGADFRAALRALLLQKRDALRGLGIDQVVVLARDDFAIVWIHAELPDLGTGAEFLNDVLATPVQLQHERILCPDDPPTVSLAASRALNFVFVREAKFFLR